MLKRIYLGIFCIIGISIMCMVVCTKKEKVMERGYVKATYIPTYKVWHAEEVPGDLLTQVNIAFATIKPDFNIEINTVEGLNLQEELLKLRQYYPNLKINLSIGGWGADGFSDLALTSKTREIFIDSIVEAIELYYFDGVDIDWEYPTQGEKGGIKFRKEDTENFILLMKEIRGRLDNLEKIKKQDYTLSFAAPLNDWAVKALAIHEVSKSVDYIYLMGYDFAGPWTLVTGHHSNLLDNEKSPIHLNIYESIKEYLKVCPSEKMVLGVPAYGYAWKGVSAQNNGLFQKATKALSLDEIDLSYNNLKKNYISNNNFKAYWDDTSKAAYLYNEDIWITYEAPRAIGYKADMVKKLNLGGMMYWEHMQDITRDIITTISNKLN